jgi:Zn-dependent protease
MLLSLLCRFAESVTEPLGHEVNGMNGSIRIGNLFGIPFFINPSWFVILAYVTWSYGNYLYALFPEMGGLAWLLGLGTALMLFASVLAHELGHSLVALSQGIAVKSITLFIFGGLASLEEESKTPGDAFKVAIAGPLVSFVLAGVFLLMTGFLTVPAPVLAVLGLLTYVNLALGLFNLIPGLPLDGGNVLKALVWKITGKPYKGIAFASGVGQFFGWVGILLGLASILGFSDVGSVWTLLVGWFLLQNAGRSAQSAAVQEKLSGLTAADAVYPKSPVVKASLSLRELANDYIIGSEQPWRKFMVTDDEGKLIGEIEVDAMKTIPTNDWWNVNVEALTKPIDALTIIPAKESLLDVINRLQEDEKGVLAVVNEEGVLLGLIEKASIFLTLQRQAEAENNPAPVSPSEV